MLDRDFWNGRRVLITGHTGFKGSWLTLLLGVLGARVAGLALAPTTSPNLFELASVEQGIGHRLADVTRLAMIEPIFTEHSPEILFHLAAQPLVLSSYEDPVGTYATNVMGTVNVLDAVRRCPSIRAVVIVTSDKCYDNQEWVWPYRETDRVGGHDPYSNSKGCAELVIDAYRRSFFNPAAYGQHRVALASARAGNVIGGGDWALNRLVPDAMRAFSGGRPLLIRRPKAIRPWQHVMDPLLGYLMLAHRLFAEGPQFGSGWNFGPENSGDASVERVATMLSAAWGPSAQWQTTGDEIDHEDIELRLDSAKARKFLGWRSLLPLPDAIALTVDWYSAWNQAADMRRLTIKQIEAVLARA